MFPALVEEPPVCSWWSRLADVYELWTRRYPELMTATSRIDLNADLGESFGRWTLGDDAAMLEIVSSANVACGFHAGDPLTMIAALEGAATNGVAVGAHVSYRDLAGFGRRYVAATSAELKGDVLYQLAAIEGLARVAGTTLRYVKPHGALYNRIVHDPVHAQAVVDAVVAFDATLPIMGLPGSVVLELAAEAGLATRTEAFADRAYNPDGTLVSRNVAGSVIHDVDAVAARSVRIAVEGTVESMDGGVVELGRVDSLCVHSDTPGAVELARAVRAALESARVEIRAVA